MMNWYHDGSTSGSSLLYMWIMWAVLIGLGIWLVRWFTQRDHTNEKYETPRQILDRRFASGDLDAVEYAKSRRLLEGHGSDTEKSK